MSSRIRLSSFRLLSLLISLAVVSPDSYADVLNVAPSGDTSLFSQNGGLAGGGLAGLFVGFTQGGDERRALLRFDVAAALPVGATINSVTLNLTTTRARGLVTGELHAVSASWQEGTASGGGGGGGGGSAAATGDVTWTYRSYSSVLWTSLGGDFSAAVSASAVIPSVGGTAMFSSSTMVTDVQGWIDVPASNFGWMLVPAVGSLGARRLGSRENGTARPSLAIDYTPLPTTGACCEASGACTVVDAPGTTCAGTYQGLGVACSIDLCPQPTGACCLPTAQATCQLETAVDCAGLGGIYQGNEVACVSNLCPVVLEPFVDALPLPKIATPTVGNSGGAAQYRMTEVRLAQKLHRDLPPTTVWGFDDGTGGTYPGPTISATSGQPVQVTWASDLRDEAGVLLSEHVLAVDTCAHGADDASPRTVVHLHGGHVPAAYDGYPEATILPGEEVVYQYPNLQDAATLWYHDHALGITRLNVYMGLAGFYLLGSDEESALGLPSGKYDIPLVIQDRTFNADGSLQYPAAWRGNVVHDTALVNGKVWPYFEVDKGKYRFRVLNGSGTRTYRLGLSDGRNFSVIGSDGGLLEAPVAMSQLVLAPGERSEIVIDFGRYADGAEIVLRNDAPAPYPGNEGQSVVPNIMKFVVGTSAGYTNPLPTALRTIEPLSQENLAAERDFVLARGSDTTCGQGPSWLINGLGWDDIRERPRLGTTEIWRFINDTNLMHPMHMHLVFFQVLDVQDFDQVEGAVVPRGTPFPPAPQEGGWKDTVQVPPGKMVRVIAKFEDFTGRFAYHCHILEHEDHEMMRQFETFSECGDGAVGMPEEACDDGGPSATCDADCTLPVCGDGTLNTLAGEECDDGNTENDATCSADCSIPKDDVVPPVMGASDGGGGCGCGTTGPSGASGALLLLAGVLVLLSLSRRRSRN